ncbi:MAG: chromate efflux transporter [Pseudomonadota bacterium]|nr:chromate efflux transporter [Pseudomonadota bacterium]
MTFAEQSAAPRASFRALVGESARIGFLGFGGPAGQIALMHRIFVDERKWVDEDTYLHSLNYCMLLPGPEAQQLAAYIGWRLHGVKGGLAAGLLFVAPGAALILALSWIYAAYGAAPAIVAGFYGVKAAVLAFVVEAFAKIGRRALKTRLDAAVAAASFAVLTLFGAPFPLIVLAAMAAGYVWAKPHAPAKAPEAARAPAGAPVKTALVWAFVWLAPLAASFVLLGPDHLLTKVGALFATLAVVTFGGAYAVLAYLAQQAVDAQGWLTAAQMVDGLGLAETTPGPLVLVNQFVGFLAGWQAQGGGPAIALAAAAMASWQTFAPSFLWIFAGAPYADRLRSNPRAAGALRMVTASVLGVIASLAFWFAAHVLFIRTAPATTPWGHVVAAPDLLSLDPYAALIAAAAAVALIRFKANAILVVLAAAAAGYVPQLLGR